MDNKCGYYGMGKEIIVFLGMEIDEFVMVVGGGGCIFGNFEVLKVVILYLCIVVVELLNVRNIFGGGIIGIYKLEGIGFFFVFLIFWKDLIDDIVVVLDVDVYYMVY